MFLARTFLAGFVVAAACVLLVAQDVSPDRQYGRVWLRVATAENCPPCRRLEAALHGPLAQTRRGLRVQYDDGSRPDLVPYRFRATPTVVVHVAGADDRWYERFRMTGYSERDRAVLEAMIDRAAEQ